MKTEARNATVNVWQLGSDQTCWGSIRAPPESLEITGSWYSTVYMSHSTYYTSFSRPTFQPVIWLVQKTGMVLITNDLVGTSKTNTTTTKWQHKKPKQQQRKVLHVSYVKLNLTTLQPGSTRLSHHLASKWIAPQPHRGLNWGKGTHRKEEKRGRGKGAIILRHFLFYYKGKCIYIALFL